MGNVSIFITFKTIKFVFLKILFIHLRQRYRKHEQEERQSEREKQTPPKPGADVGLDSGTPGS